jgi:hypothetical protein
MPASTPSLAAPTPLTSRGTGGGVLDRRAFGIGRRASISGRGVQLDLAVRASRVVTGTRIAVHTTDHMHNQHAHDRRAELALQP